MGTTIPFKRPDGKDASGYLVNAERGDAPGVVVIQEWWGLQEQIKGMCDRFALAGFDALAPDLYKGKVVPYHDTDAAGKEMNSLDFIDATTQTVRGAVQYLAKNGAKVGLTGFCLGGAVTIIGATKIPELTAGVVFYTLQNVPSGNVAQFTRKFECLGCHVTGDTLGVPGLLMFSTTRPEPSQFSGFPHHIDRTPDDEDTDQNRQDRVNQKPSGVVNHNRANYDRR